MSAEAGRKGAGGASHGAGLGAALRHARTEWSQLGLAPADRKTETVPAEAAKAKAGITLANVTKTLSPGTGAAAVNDVTLQIEPGQFVTLLGASGSGKTTILRLIAGLVRPDEGTIHIGGKLVSSPERTAAQGVSGLGVMFQRIMGFGRTEASPKTSRSDLRGAHETPTRDGVPSPKR